MLKITRRDALILGATSMAAFSLNPVSVFAADNNAAELVAKFTGGKKLLADKIDLDLPEIAENGNSVPMTVTVDTEMTKADHVKRVLVVADGNPRGGLAVFNFSLMSGVAEVSTRIRLSKTQKVTALAEMSDGSFRTASRTVKVTIGGCGG